MDSHPRPPRAVGDVRIGAEDPRGARRPALEPLQALHEGRLSGPVRADDSEDFTVGDVEGDAVDGEKIAEPLRQGFDRHCRRAGCAARIG